MDKKNLKKIAIMGLAAGLSLTSNASAEESFNPARNRTQNQSSSRLQGWKPHLDSAIPGYTHNRQIAERHENDDTNNNGNNGNNDHGNNGNGKNGNGNGSSCAAKGGCPGRR